jgi:hypothetical protein
MANKKRKYYHCNDGKRTEKNHIERSENISMATEARNEEVPAFEIQGPGTLIQTTGLGETERTRESRKKPRARIAEKN